MAHVDGASLVDAGVLWALVASLGFGMTQIMNRKSNLLVDAFRTAFGLLLAVEALLIGRLVLTGEIGLLADVPLNRPYVGGLVEPTETSERGL